MSFYLWPHIRDVQYSCILKKKLGCMPNSKAHINCSGQITWRYFKSKIALNCVSEVEVVRIALAQSCDVLRSVHDPLSSVATTLQAAMPLVFHPSHGIHFTSSLSDQVQFISYFVKLYEWQDITMLFCWYDILKIKIRFFLIEIRTSATFLINSFSVNWQNYYIFALINEANSE